MADILPILMPDEQHENKVVKCIRTGRYEQALDLIDKGEAINDKDKSGWTPLTALMHFGSGNDGHINCLNCAISRGADIDAQGIHGWTALMYAANHNHNICLLHLLERGANLHVTNHSNETAVRYIKSNNHCLTAYEEWKTIIWGHRRQFVTLLQGCDNEGLVVDSIVKYLLDENVAKEICSYLGPEPKTYQKIFLF